MNPKHATSKRLYFHLTDFSELSILKQLGPTLSLYYTSTSSNTIFLVRLLDPLPMNAKTFDGSVDLDRATYSWPWVNTGVSKLIPTQLIPWPWLLLIVMAKQGLTGNWYLLNFRWNWVSSTTQNILKRKWIAPAFSPDRILTFMWFSNVSRTNNRVPLFSPTNMVMVTCNSKQQWSPYQLFC